MSTAHQRRSSARLGYTIVELLIVLLICSILTAVALPRYVDSLCQFRVDAAAKRIAADIGLAQRQAMVQSKDQSIQFTINGGPGAPNTYAMPNVNYVDKAPPGVVVDLTQYPYQVVINSASFGAGASLVFDRFGNPSSGGAVVVAAGNCAKTINVDSNTGRVTIP